MINKNFNFRKIGFKVEEKMRYLNRKSTMCLDVLQYFSAVAIFLQNKLLVLSKFYCNMMGRAKPFIIHILNNDKSGKSFSAYFYILGKR